MTDTAIADTPRLAYSALERRATLATIAVLLALAAAAWWLTLGNAQDMRGMSQGLGTVGVAMPMDMSVLVFMGMWLAMMVAMMFPTIAPIVLLHRLVMRRHHKGLAPTVAFTTGYLVVWTVVGVIPLGALIAFRDVSDGAGWVAPVAGAVLLVAGAYQFTAWKETCLRACRSPLTFLATHDFGSGLRGTLRAGASHGLYCLGCCWALMTVLFVVGLMNLVWMAGIAVVFLVEKNVEHGRQVTWFVGTAVLGLGVAVLIHPALLSSLIPASPVMTEMS